MPTADACTYFDLTGWKRVEAECGPPEQASSQQANTLHRQRATSADAAQRLSLSEMLKEDEACGDKQLEEPSGA